MRKLAWAISQLVLLAGAASAQMKYGASDDPKDYPAALAREEKWVAAHPRYSFSKPLHMTPEELMGEVETRGDWSNWVVQQKHLEEAAKAALLLGNGDKAKDFASRALQVSDGASPSGARVAQARQPGCCAEVLRRMQILLDSQQPTGYLDRAS